jgi:hypothetical protein
MTPALKVVALFVGLFVFFISFLPWALPLLMESNFCRLSPNEFCREAEIERLEKSSADLREQFEATRESLRRLVASVAR